MAAKKPSLDIVLGMGKTKSPMGDEPDGDEAQPEYSEEQHTMASELIDSIKSGDAGGVLDAIHGIYQSYQMGEDSDAGEPSPMKAY